MAIIGTQKTNYEFSVLMILYIFSDFLSLKDASWGKNVVLSCDVVVMIQQFYPNHSCHSVYIAHNHL